MMKINSNSRLDNLLQEITDKYKVDINLVQKLITFEETKAHLEKRRGAKQQIRKIIESSIEEVNQ